MGPQARALGRRRRMRTSWRVKFQGFTMHSDAPAGQGFGQAAEDAHELAGPDSGFYDAIYTMHF